MKTIGITMGCPVGIGPEIILNYFSKTPPPPDCRLFVIGDRGVLENCSQQLDFEVKICDWSPDQEQLPAGTLHVLSLSNLPANKLHWGTPTTETGSAMAQYITRGIELALNREIDAIVTCPIAKSALNNAGYQYPGHTEMLASLTAAKDYAMMLAGPKLRVTLVTIHNALRDVPELLTPQKIINLIQLTGKSLQRDFGITHPRIAVAGFNPHAGEDGLFGDEEDALIKPAIAHFSEESLDVTGPYPPDTVFFKAAAGQFDAVVCMYHDQGLIPFKLLHFDDGVNVTLGLPIVRTSVDHGTAYDIAGKGIAKSSSLAAAIDLAASIAHNRAQFT